MHGCVETMRANARCNCTLLRSNGALRQRASCCTTNCARCVAANDCLYIRCGMRVQHKMHRHVNACIHTYLCMYAMYACDAARYVCAVRYATSSAAFISGKIILLAVAHVFSEPACRFQRHLRGSCEFAHIFVSTPDTSLYPPLRA